MGKSGAIDDLGGEGGCAAAAAAVKVTELKRELLRLMKAIVAEDISEENFYGLIDRAHQTLSALKGLVIKPRSFGRNYVDSAAVPEEFRCPLSKELMKDPVIVASGQTYDKVFINKWLKAGNRSCPQTEQVLSHTLLTPNVLIRDMISKWCKNNGIQMQDHAQYSEDEGLTETDRQSFTSLLNDLSSSPSSSHRKTAAKELRSLTKRIPSFRALFGESPDVIPKLISPLTRSQPFSNVEAGFHEDVITTLLNLSIHDNNKKIVAENPDVIRVLISSLKTGNTETRSNSAATLFTLSALDTNKTLIGKSGALKLLIEVLEEGHPSTVKDVASAIFSLCILHENRTRAIRDGAVRVIVMKIKHRVQVDELLAILALLSSNQKAVDEMGEIGGVGCLISVMREISCPRSKENCIAILHSICYNDRTKWKEMREEEINHRTISQLAENGTSRAKRKASGILERLNRANILTHTA